MGAPGTWTVPGTTSGGGAHSTGVVFEIQPSAKMCW